jgi:hypothetical protein
VPSLPLEVVILNFNVSDFVLKRSVCVSKRCDLLLEVIMRRIGFGF